MDLGRSTHKYRINYLNKAQNNFLGQYVVFF
jgi:hypothetical protein